MAASEMKSRVAKLAQRRPLRWWRLLVILAFLGLGQAACARSAIEQAVCVGANEDAELGTVLTGMVTTARSGRLPIAAVFVTAHVPDETANSMRSAASYLARVLQLLYAGQLDPRLPLIVNIVVVENQACQAGNFSVEVNLLLDDSEITRDK